MEQARHRWLETLLGLALAGALMLAVVVIYKSFRGDFSSDIGVSASVAQAGDALEAGDVVTYRDVIVGEVTASTGAVGGGSALELKIHRDAARVIPASVTAIAVPESLFGQTKIVLVPGRDTSGPRLRDGSVVAPDASPGAESLQTALSKAYTLLTSIHPAELDAALSALATALDGQGENLGVLVGRADRYLRRLAPHLPELDDVLTSFTAVTDELAKNSPALLRSLANLLVTSRSVLADRQAVAALFAVAPTAVDSAQRLFSARNVDNTVAVLVNETSVLGAAADNPQALPQTIEGFKAFADTFAGVIHDGAVSGNLILTGANFVDLANVFAGKQGRVFQAITDPTPYTAAQCPRYPGADGPNCAKPSAAPDVATARLLTSGGNYGGSSTSIGSPAELAAVSGAAAAITGLPAGRLPEFADLLLGPLLRGTPTVIR